nr:MAG TPA: hypothetical protein [Bacteriophage sp.]
MRILFSSLVNVYSDKFLPFTSLMPALSAIYKIV